MSVGAEYLAEVARRLADPALAAALPPVADALARRVAAGGLAYVFGTGHSHLLALELHYRAGGPAFAVPVLDEALMLHRGAVASTLREREAGAAAAALARYPVGAGDALLVVSNSGVNAAPVEAVLWGRARGALTVAVTSRAYSAAGAQGRPRIADLADLVLDNGLPPGDALVPLPGTALRAGPGSGAVGAAMLQALFAEVAARLPPPPPIYLSANMPGAEAHNRELVARFGPRNPHL